MKKVFFIVFLTTILTGIIIAGSINVTNPRAGNVFNKGETMNISWTVSGCTDTNFKINIFRNSVAEANFVEQLLASGVNSKNWTIPMAYESGNYVMRVKTEDNACYGDSGVFSITEPSSPEPGTAPSITVTSPTTGTKWLKGTTKTITWNKSGDLDSNVKINIFKNSISEANFVMQLTGRNSGTKSWAIPESYAPGTYYIRVKEATGDIKGDSNAFEIIQKFVLQPMITAQFKPHSIKVVEPNRGTYAQNSTMRILWIPKNLTNNVKITLLKGRNVVGTIAENIAPGRISYEWTIGRTLIKTVRPDSGFKIKIEEMGKNVMDLSDNSFTIEESRSIDLSCYISSHSSRDHEKVVRLIVKVRINNFGGPPLARVPVRVNVRTQGSTPGTGQTNTKYLENVTYRGHSYEYSLHFDFQLHRSSRNIRRLDRVATVVVDPEDVFRDRRRMNNSMTYRFNF